MAKEPDDKSKPENERIVLLNTMLSYSTTRAKDHDPPVLGALESIKILEARRKKSWAIEFVGLDEKAPKDDARTEEQKENDRRKQGEGLNFVRLSRTHFEDIGDWTYATLLVETIDVTAKAFAVVNVKSYQGHEINAAAEERGSATAHIVVRIPKHGAHDIGRYRCAIETVSQVTRTEIEQLLTRQLRRHSNENPDEMSFSVQIHKGKKPEQKTYRFWPKLELNADVGRKLNVGDSLRTFSHMVFSKRLEKQTIGKGTAVDHEEFLADVEYRIGASQGPAKPEDQRSWIEKVSAAYRSRDFEARYYYRNNDNGRIEGGPVHKAIASATDLLMCQRTTITLKKAPKIWVSTINAEIVSELKKLLDRDELWERSK